MTTPTKRRRGRPIGTGIDDRSTLRAIAELLHADPALRPTTAIKRLLRTLDPSVIRRLQVKWRAEGARHLAQARAHRTVAAPRAPGPISRCSPRTARQLAAAQRAMNDALGISGLASVQSALESPGLRAVREMMGSTAILAAQEAARRYRESPAMRVIEELQTSPAMQAMRELHASHVMQAMRKIHHSTTMRAARAAALEIENSKPNTAQSDVETTT